MNELFESVLANVIFFLIIIIAFLFSRQSPGVYDPKNYLIFYNLVKRDPEFYNISKSKLEFPYILRPAQTFTIYGEFSLYDFQIYVTDEKTIINISAHIYGKLNNVSSKIKWEFSKHNTSFQFASILVTNQLKEIMCLPDDEIAIEYNF